MSGRRLGSFRAGDRSEYLALFGLSRVAFVDPFPRQEDFGIVDFLCVLTRQSEDRNVYPESAFYVQVKSNAEPIVLDAHAVRWISHHMAHPLFVCVVDRAGATLTLWSCARIMPALFLRAEPVKVTLYLDEATVGGQEAALDESDGSRFQIHLGAPVLRQTLTDLNSDPALAFGVLDAWIRMDAANVTRRGMGRIATQVFWDWKTNEIPNRAYQARYIFGPNYGEAETAVAPLLVALAHNYRHHEQRERFDAVCGLLKVLQDHVRLDEHGLGFANGKYKIDA